MEIPIHNKYKYDVFLSFRGETRCGFTAFLHKALQDAKIITFYDDEEIETGEPLKQILVEGIRTSRASVIVLSENYASSTWCLDELQLILQQNGNSNHLVFPIFYKVEPTNVRKITGSFQVGVAKHIKKMDDETDPAKKREWAERINKWKIALTEVAGLKGETTTTTGPYETKVIDNIIADIYHRLGVLLSMKLPVLIGMDDHIRFISSWLIDGSTHTVDILTILGMGGIGKTDLAKYVYVKHSHLFQKSSFLLGINKTCGPQQSDNILGLQSQLYSDISKQSLVQVRDVGENTSKIEKALKYQKVLLVLDDVDNVSQLDMLLGDKGFHPGSKIIVTTKDTSSTKKFEPRKANVQPMHTVCLLKGLNKTSSQQLLSSHASMSNGLKGDFEEVSEKLLKYCEGHPGVLKEIGLHLRGLHIKGWKEYIKILDDGMDRRIKRVLGMSIDSLPHPNDKELFKHIASFFAGKDRVFVETILEACDIHMGNGIKNLTDRCFLTIGPRNELMMHRLLQELGRDVVRQESHAQPWKRSRLWCHADLCKALDQKKGKRKLEGIVLDSSVNKAELNGDFDVDADELSTMDNLLLLKLNHVKVNGPYKNFPKQLVWLCMHGFPEQSIPPDLPVGNLVVLDISYSKIEHVDFANCNVESVQHLTWKNRRVSGSCSKDNWLLRSLKILNLSFCDQLCSLLSLFKLPALERLILAGCRSLINICEKIDECKEIVIIDLSYCIMLKKLPRNVFKLKKLEALSLDGCNLHEFPAERDKDIQKLLNANIICIASQASSSITVDADVSPFAICLASSLGYNSLRDNNCSNESFPMEFSSLSSFEKLFLDGKEIVSLLNCVRSLRRIELLSSQECNMLNPKRYPPHTLRKLKFNRWKLQQQILFGRKKSSLDIALDIYSLANSSIQIEGIVKIKPITSVDKEVLHSLGWNGLDFLQKEVKTWNDLRKQKMRVQFFYEFGIFSTFYGGKEIPYWIERKEEGSSISFTMRPSSNNLKGLNFFYRLEGRDKDDGINLLTVKVSNQTKKRTWIYKHYIHWVKVDEESFIWLSHWMFGKNEMEGGDKVTITIPEDVSAGVSIKECGYGFLYDGRNVKYDSLCDYKSWNHIIGGDLSAFQLTTGDYFLDNHRYFWWHIDCPVYRPFISSGSCYEEKGVYFGAHRRQSHYLVDDTPENVTELKELQLICR